MSGGVFVGMNESLMGGINTILEGQTSIYGSMINVIAVSSFTTYIIWRGYQTVAGKLQRPIEDVAWDTSRYLVIMMFVLNVGGWLNITIDSINALKNGVSGNDNVWMLLDTVWDKAQDLGQKLYNKDDSVYFKFSGAFSEFLVWFGSIIVLTTGTIVNLLAEITILLLCTTAPLFIFCLLYGFLRPMFDNWLKTIFTAILTILFSALFIRISIKYLNSILDSASNLADDSNMVTLAAQCLLAGIGAGVVIWFSARIAQALGGVATQATMQGVAKAGITSTTNVTRSAAGGIGDRAAANINRGAAANRTASIRNMQYLNNHKR